VLQPTDLAGELGSLRIGAPVVAWYREEIGRLRRAKHDVLAPATADEWAVFEQEFLLQPAAR